MNEWVFVYGTLRRGGSNAHRMEGARFLGEASVQAALYRVDHARDFLYPALVPSTDGGLVRGEVFEVPPGVLAALDEFEGDEYVRQSLPLQDLSFPSPQGTASVWVWKGSVDGLTRLPSGDWLAP